MTDLYKVNQKIDEGKLDLLAFIYKKIGTREGKKGYLIIVSDANQDKKRNIYCFDKPTWDNVFGELEENQWYILKNLNKNEGGYIYFNDDSTTSFIPDISLFNLKAYRSRSDDTPSEPSPTPTEPSKPKPETKTKSDNDPISEAYELIIKGLDKMRSGFEILLKAREVES